VGRIASTTDERADVLHSWCVQAEWNAPTIVGGRGARFFDAAGRAYLDMSSLAECSNLGHQHPAVVAAIRAQAEQLCFVTNAWGATPRAELARVLLEKSGFAGGRVYFTLGGADANEHAVKFARQASGLSDGLVVTRARAGAAARSARSRYRRRTRIAVHTVRRTHMLAPSAPRNRSPTRSTKMRAAVRPCSWNPMPAPTASLHPITIGRPCAKSRVHAVCT
jgi:taurine--2-oxoglutarate transaminase